MLVFDDKIVEYKGILGLSLKNFKSLITKKRRKRQLKKKKKRHEISTMLLRCGCCERTCENQEAYH